MVAIRWHRVAQSRPLAQTKGHAPPSRLDLTVLRVVGLVELAQVDTAVTCRHTDVVRPADVVLQLDVDTFSHGLDGRVDVVDRLA